MTGTDKQIQWAENIKTEWIARQLNRCPANHPMREIFAEALEVAAADVLDASVWIDNQSNLDAMLNPIYQASVTRIAAEHGITRPTR